MQVGEQILAGEWNFDFDRFHDPQYLPIQDSQPPMEMQGSYLLQLLVADQGVRLNESLCMIG